MRTVIVACVVALVAVISAQTPPDCDELDVGAPEPFTGVDLPICGRVEAQCCSAEFLQSVREKVRQRLERFLREEFEDVIYNYQDEIENLLEYFKEDFIEELLLNLPFSDRLNRTNRPLIRNILRFLADNFEIDDIDIDDFDVRNFIESLLDAIVDTTARNFGQTVSTVQCITRVVRSLVNRNAVGALTSQLQRIRRAITALMEISRFLEQQRDRLQSATVLEECVSTFIEIAFCSRCTRKTPPMCFGTCNALLRGCYSPYYTALNRQYLPLWIEVRRIIELANDTVEEFLSGEGDLLDTSKVVSQLLSECRPTVNNGQGNGRGRRDHKDDHSQDHSPDIDSDGSGDEENSKHKTRNSDGSGDEESSKHKTRNSDGSGEEETKDTTGDSDSSLSARKKGPGMAIPFGLVDDLFDLTGAFEYGRRGLRFCLDALDDEEICTPVEQDNDDLYCKGDDICTSKCYCTDGRNFTKNNETDQVFNLNDVKDQGNNPVFGMSVAVLEAEEARILGMEDPIAAFLTSDEYTAVAPEDQEGGDGDSSSAGVVASLSILLLSLLTACM